MPEAARAPACVLVGNLEYCLRKQDGKIAIGTCLTEDDIERLKTDDELLGFAKFHG